MFQHRSFSNAMAAPPTSGKRHLTRSINNLVRRVCDDVTALPSSIRLHQRHDKGSNFGECDRSKASVLEFPIISRDLLELWSSDKLHCVVVWSVREVVDRPLVIAAQIWVFLCKYYYFLRCRVSRRERRTSSKLCELQMWFTSLQNLTRGLHSLYTSISHHNHEYLL